MDRNDASRVDLGELTRLRRAFGGILDRLERCTPAERAGLFYLLEVEWCWDCGLDQLDCEGHGYRAALSSVSGGRSPGEEPR